MLNPTQLPTNENPFLIEGPTGPLELLFLPASSVTHDVGVICHPHPLHEGTMYNKVVHTISRAFHHKGLHAVRFNYRGVGQSGGTYGNSIGEVDDLLAVIAWITRLLPQARFWLAGFSFGAYIAAKGASSLACQQLLSVAPAVHHQPYAELGMINCPWEIIQGENDEVVSPDEVYAFVAQRKNVQPYLRLHKIPDASHFFHGKLMELRTVIETFFIKPDEHTA